MTISRSATPARHSLPLPAAFTYAIAHTVLLLLRDFSCSVFLSMIELLYFIICCVFVFPHAVFASIQSSSQDGVIIETVLPDEFAQPRAQHQNYGNQFSGVKEQAQLHRIHV